MSEGEVLCLLVMIVGLAGVVVPVLPGTLLVLGAGVAWGVWLQDDGAARWLVLTAMGALFAVGLVAKYLLPGRRLAGQLPRRSLLLGAAGAVVGLVLLPPFGLVLGGVLGVYLGEVARVGARAARGSTMQVLRAIGLGILAELSAGVAMVAVWLLGVLVT